MNAPLKLTPSKYGLHHAPPVGSMAKIEGPAEKIMHMAEAARVSCLKWCKRHNLPWRFRVRCVQTPDEGSPYFTIQRVEDRSAENSSTAVFIPSEMDQIGDTHRKYRFDKLTAVGMTLELKTIDPKKDRVSAHAAGYQWSKQRQLGWKFKVRVAAANKIVIERVA